MTWYHWYNNNKGCYRKFLRSQKNMQEQQKLLMEKQEIFEKKLNSLEESTVSSGSDGHKKARVTRRPGSQDNSLWVVIMLYVSYLSSFLFIYVLLQNLVAEAYDALEDDFIQRRGVLNKFIFIKSVTIVFSLLYLAPCQSTISGLKASLLKISSLKSFPRTKWNVSTHLIG